MSANLNQIKAINNLHFDFVVVFLQIFIIIICLFFLFIKAIIVESDVYAGPLDEIFPTTAISLLSSAVF